MSSAAPTIVTRNVESFWDKALRIAQEIADNLEAVSLVLEEINATLEEREAKGSTGDAD